MSVAGARVPARRLAIPALVTLAGICVLAGLGLWQLERKAWKDALIESLTERLAAPAIDLPRPESWATLSPREWEFKRVKFSGAFLREQEALVYTVGSALRPDVSGAGYWVFTPARLPESGVVMVNRGFVPEGEREPASRRERTDDLVAITGVMRWPERPGLFTPDHNPQTNVWYLRDHAAIAAARGLGAVAPFYIDQEASVLENGPRAGPLRVRLPNNHLQYAITWFALAAALLTVFLVWAFRPR